MSEDTYTINYKPGHEHLKQIQDWMIAENREGKGYEHDISVLQAHFDDRTIIVVTQDEYAVGFVTWSKRGRVAYLHHAAVMSQMRRKQVGRLLIEAWFVYLLTAGVMASYLMSVSNVAEKFWRSMGFQELPELPGYTDRDHPYLYKILVEHQHPTNVEGEYIQVYAYGSDEMASWPVIYRPGTSDLIKPIIAPVSGDWCIEHVKTHRPEYPNVIKRFRSGEYLDDPFLCISVL